MLESFYWLSATRINYIRGWVNWANRLVIQSFRVGLAGEKLGRGISEMVMLSSSWISG